MGAVRCNSVWHWHSVLNIVVSQEAVYGFNMYMHFIQLLIYFHLLRHLAYLSKLCTYRVGDAYYWSSICYFTNVFCFSNLGVIHIIVYSECGVKLSDMCPHVYKSNLVSTSLYIWFFFYEQVDKNPAQVENIHVILAYAASRFTPHQLDHLFHLIQEVWNIAWLI